MVLQNRLVQKLVRPTSHLAMRVPRILGCVLPGRRVFPFAALLVLIFGSLLLAPLFSMAKAQQLHEATIYYSASCAMCATYVATDLQLALRESGVEKVTVKEYMENQQNRKELTDLMGALRIPPELQGHIITRVDSGIILGGHVPSEIVRDLLSTPPDRRPKMMLVLQDEMHGHATNYQVWDFQGQPVTYPINAPISQFLREYEQTKDAGTSNAKGAPSALAPQTSNWDPRQAIPIVLSAGFLDGLNPCAFAVLLFFIAIMFTFEKTRKETLAIGGVYVAGIYITYFLIGLGILRVFLFAGTPHLVAKVGAALVIIVGMLFLKDFLFPGSPVSLKMSPKTQKLFRPLMYRVTVPSAFGAGALVGLCSFPCAGGIYVAILGLVASQASFAQGLGYLSAYNLMFVLPLLIVLVLAINRTVVTKLSNWHRTQARRAHLVSGILTIAIGVIILAWLV